MADQTADECIGMAAHAWVLRIEEGRVGVTTTPCSETCNLAAGEHGDPFGDYWEWLEMPDMPVTLAMATDCPAYDTDDQGVPTGPKRKMGGYESGSHYIVHGERCDCNWWPVARVKP